GQNEARRGLTECRRFIESNRRPLVGGVVGLHASFTVSDDTIREAGDLCRELRTVMHVHVAEDRADLDDARRRGYEGPLERLEALGALPSGSILAHGVHLDAAQVRHAGSRGWWIVQNPRSNRNNRVGYPRALGESARVALGTDGFVSDMRDEAAALREEASAHGERPDVAETRARAGQELAAERLGVPAMTGAPPEIGSVQDQLHLIRAEALEAAATLWKRMAAL
ncbi:MAG TPA: amidohydrolase family protein, partial [Gemmatimonadaceae bacterium]